MVKFILKRVAVVLRHGIAAFLFPRHLDAGSSSVVFNVKDLRCNREEG